MAEIKITDDPPIAIKNEISGLRSELDRRIPKKKPGNVLIATWNIKEFGSATKKWKSQSGDSPRRDFRAILAIAEIIKRFDVVAIQEITGNMRALRNVMKLLGDDWAFLTTDVNYGDAGDNERLGFIFHRTRAVLSGLAGELVIAPSEGVRANVFQEQFARSPYAVSFRADKTTFILVTVHILFGDRPADRKPELRAIAEWMKKLAKREKGWGHNFLLLGDFNIDRRGDDLFDIFVSSGLAIPADLENQPRTIFALSTNASKTKHYDQVAWFLDRNGKPELTMQYVKGDTFDFRTHIFAGLKNQSLQWRMSDHFPLWTEFKRTP